MINKKGLFVTDGKGTTIKGFDITTKKGLITIANNKKIYRRL